MKNTKKILFSRQLHEKVVIRSRKRTSTRCGLCLTHSDFVSLDAAVNLVRIGARQILEKIERGEIHGIETRTGHLLVCVRSLCRQ
jgi:hypothetical protein